MKMCLAIRIHKSSILSVTILTLLPIITSSFENIISCQYNVWSWYEAIPVHQTSSLGFWGNPKTYVIKFFSTFAEDTGESTSCRWNRKRPMSLTRVREQHLIKTIYYFRVGNWVSFLCREQLRSNLGAEVTGQCHCLSGKSTQQTMES